MSFEEIYLQTGWLLFPLGAICFLIWVNLTLPYPTRRGPKAQLIQQRISWVKALTAAAPLLGLLGTVLGLMNSFSSMAQGLQVQGWSSGIAQALLSTQLGLLVSIPGLLGCAWLKRLHQHAQRSA
jgi:biopolymer transport protein ExbB